MRVLYLFLMLANFYYPWEDVIFYPSQVYGLPTFFDDLKDGKVSTAITLLPGGLKSYEVYGAHSSYFANFGYLDLGSFRERDEFGEPLSAENLGMVRGDLGLKLRYEGMWAYFSLSAIQFSWKYLSETRFFTDWGLQWERRKIGEILLFMRIGEIMESGLGVKGDYYAFFASGKSPEDFHLTALGKYSYKGFEFRGGLYYQRFEGGNIFKPLLILSYKHSQRLGISYFYRLEPDVPDVYGFQLFLR